MQVKNVLLVLTSSLLLAMSMNSCKHAQKLADDTKVSFPVVDWAKNATIYEVNIRQFSKEGTFNAVTKELPRIQKMGVDIVWLMPIYPISKVKRKGGLGSPYAVADYKAVHPDYGSMEDLKTLVKEAHKLNMKVILDWVPNHTGWDNPWITKHPDWYTHANGKITDPLDEKGKSVGWEDVADLNYDNQEMRKEMIESMRFWLTNADVDGFRCDVAGFVPDDFWRQCRKALDQTKKVFMLAEWEKPEHFDNGGFDMGYGWAYHALIKQIVKKEKNANDLDAFFTEEKQKYPKGFIKMMFTNNHDENSWNGTTRESFGDAADCMFALSATVSGMPLVYNGQEANLDKRLAFFEKDPIDWSNMSKENFFKTLLSFKHSHPGLGNGTFGQDYERIPTDNDKNVFAFVRGTDNDQVLCIFNLSAEKTTVTLNSDKLKGNYKDAFGGKEMEVTNGYKLTLAPWKYFVMSYKPLPLRLQKAPYQKMEDPKK